MTYGPLVQTALGGALAVLGGVVAPLVTARATRRHDADRRAVARVEAIDAQQAVILGELQEALLAWSRSLGRCWVDDNKRFRAPERWDEVAAAALHEEELAIGRTVRALSFRVLDEAIRRHVASLFEVKSATMPLTARPTEEQLSLALAAQSHAVDEFALALEMLGEEWRWRVTARLDDETIRSGG